MRLLYTFMTLLAGVESWAVNEESKWVDGDHLKSRVAHI